MNARKLSDVLGEQEVIESSENVSFGANEIRDGVSFSHQKRFQPLIRPSDIMQLKPLSCYAKIANVNVVFKHEFGYLDLPIIAADFVEKEKVEKIESMGAEREDAVCAVENEKVMAGKLRLVDKDYFSDDICLVENVHQLDDKNLDAAWKIEAESSCIETLMEKSEEVEIRRADSDDECIYAQEVFEPADVSAVDMSIEQAFKFELSKIK